MVARKEYIKENQVAIWTFWFHKPSEKLYKSALREDHNPTCGFFYHKDGTLLLRDFATGDTYDVIRFVSKLTQVGITTAEENIYTLRDEYRESEVFKVIPKVMEYIEKPLDPAYYLTQGISERTLKRFKVKQARAVYTNETLTWRSTDSNPIFIYDTGPRFKAYRPLSKDKTKKWLSTTKVGDVFGLDQLPATGQILLITSSAKDVLLLFELGFNAVCFTSETIPTRGENGKIIEAIIKNLEERFQEVIFFMNNDEQGLTISKVLSKKFKKRYIVLPEGPKDPTDYRKKYGRRKTRATINKLFKKPLIEENELPY